MWVTFTFSITLACYTLAAGMYAFFLVKGSQRRANIAATSLGGGLFAHVVFVAQQVLVHDRLPTDDIHQALAALSLLVSLLYLVTSRFRPRLRVLGAFIAPMTLLLFLGAAFRGAVPVSDTVRSYLLPVHVGVNILGLVAFAFAFAASAAYILQERQLRSKNLGGVFQRLPSLGVLDQLGLRSVLIGFPLLTVGVVTGTIWAVRHAPNAPVISPSQGFGLLAWLLFAAVLLLRIAAGWQGRKAAIGTMLGFLCTVMVLIGYVLRSTPAGVS